MELQRAGHDWATNSILLSSNHLHELICKLSSRNVLLKTLFKTLLKGLENGRSDDAIILSSTSHFLHWGWIHGRTTMKEASWVKWFPMDSKRLKYGQMPGSQFWGAAKHLCPELLQAPALPVCPWVKKSRNVLGWISDHEAERNGNWQERKVKQFIILWKPAQGPVLEAKATGKHVDFPSYND